MNPINNVIITGATHGNEYTGAYLVKKFEQYPHLIKRNSFETSTLLANPEAFKQCRRYINQDLNRCFYDEVLKNPQPSEYEHIRAKQIHQQLKSDSSQFILDYHSSTANMGLTLILVSLHPFLLGLVSHLSQINPLVKILYTESGDKDKFLIAESELSLAIEVGAIAQGVLDAGLFQKTEQLTYQILDYIESFNQSPHQVQSENEFTIYQFTGAIDYPRNENGEIQAMIHPLRQFQDYQPLDNGAPLFLNFDGTTIFYQGESIVYPVFINEAAYYEKGIAMCLTSQVISNPVDCRWYL